MHLKLCVCVCVCVCDERCGRKHEQGLLDAFEVVCGERCGRTSLARSE
jgi:hypothetical protein